MVTNRCFSRSCHRPRLALLASLATAIFFFYAIISAAVAQEDYATPHERR